jgi:hypothetical protein
MTSSNLLPMLSRSDLAELYRKAGQHHVFDHYDGLSQTDQEELLEQLREVPINVLAIANFCARHIVKPFCVFVLSLSARALPENTRRFVGKCSVGSLPWSVVFGQRAGCAAAGGRRPPPHGIRRSSSPRVRNETYLAVGGACIEDSHSNEARSVGQAGRPLRVRSGVGAFAAADHGSCRSLFSLLLS